MMRVDHAGEILRAVHVDGPLTRSALATRTGVNRSTIATHVHDLADAGFVIETGGAGGHVGRPSQVVSPRAEGAVVIAVDVRGDHMTCAVVGLGGVILHRAEFAHNASDMSPQEGARLIAERSAAARDALGFSDDRLRGIGVSLPGLVDRHHGVLRYAPNLGWFDIPFAHMLDTELTAHGFESIPIALRNDADAGALAERTRGAARDVTSAVYLSGGIGIGAGIVLGGRRILDAGGLSGEVGHMIINPQGSVCDCGARGCWETEISERRLTSPAARVEVLEWLDLGLQNLVNLLNPDVVVLGDHLRQFADDLRARPHLSDRLAAREQVQFRAAALGSDSTLIGVAEAAFDPFLTNPLPT